jgi:hypothetical protein
MSLRDRLVLPRFVLPIIVAALAVLVGCGSNNSATPPPGGGFTNSNLSGTYVFSTAGTDSNGAGIFITGAFTACGCSAGTISSGGALSYGDGTVGVASNQVISGGTYKITVDGRGTAQLLTSSSLGNIGLDFVLASNNGGSVTEFDSNGTGSGTLELQTAVTQSGLAGNFAFSASGATSTGLLASAGAFSLDATGAVTAGTQDVSSLDTTTGVASSQNFTISTSSTVLVGTGTTPGTAQIIDAGGSTFTFDVYPVSAGHLKFVETDGLILSGGDAFTQQTSLPSGTLAFTVAGLDTSLLPLSAGGLLPTTSGSISAGTEDYDDGGAVATATAVAGGFTGLSGGRSILTLSSFENGGTNGVLSTYAFAAYPSSGGTLLVEIDSAGVTAGIALAQTVTSFAASQGYGLNLSAINISGSPFYEEDDIAEFTSTSSSLTGLVDYNDQGSLTADQSFSASYASLTTGRYSLSSSSFNGAFYPVDGTTVLFVEADTNQMGTGVFQMQSASASAAASSRPLAMVRIPRVRGARQRRTK